MFSVPGNNHLYSTRCCLSDFAKLMLLCYLAHAMSCQISHTAMSSCRALGPTTFRNSMILRHVPCLISIPYYEWVDKGAHLAHVYIQDKLRIEGNCDLPDFVLPE